VTSLPPTEEHIELYIELHVLLQKVTIPTKHMKQRSSEEHLVPFFLHLGVLHVTGLLPLPECKRLHKHVIGAKFCYDI
jgi:hypothetical protein